MEVTLLPQLAYSFILVFARIGTIIMLLPGFGQAGVPVRIRLGFALLFTVMMLPLVDMPSLTSVSFPYGALVALFKEMIIGFFIGFIARIVTMSTSVAGTTISNQMGLGMAQAIDPSQGIQGALFANFLGVLATTLVFTTDLHHLALAAVHDSYILFAPGAVPGLQDMADTFVTVMSEVFVIGIRISAPFLVFGLVFYLGLGVLSRLMPQIQIFFIAMPASIVMGFVLLSMLLSTMMMVYHEYFAELFSRFLVQ
ncbi:MAG: flagellar type III secretion system protein FliR [Rhizobiales bacterium]|nr:flagellar type III secretion system protein FliR [Hyphomicrobiales bacterium]